jgi:hypothetical protein
MISRIDLLDGGEMASRECPNCHSKRNWKDGLRETNLGSIQRFVCRDCSFRFSEKSYKDSMTIEVRQLCADLEAKKLDTATEITLLREKITLSTQALKQE